MDIHFFTFICLNYYPKGYKFNISHSALELRIFEPCINDIVSNSNNSWYLILKLNFIVIENNCNKVINSALATVVRLPSLFGRDVYLNFFSRPFCC